MEAWCLIVHSPDPEHGTVDESGKGDVTQMLARVSRGERSAVNSLLPLVYDELRALGASFFQQQRREHTLQPTALVHEAFLKLVGPAEIEWQSRAHFFAVAAKAMRQILTDHARRKGAAKRGGAAWHKVTLSGLQTPVADTNIDLIALDEALSKLAEIDPRQVQVVEMRFLAGLKIEEVAEVMALSAPTIEREWRMARAWLRRELAAN